MTRLNESQTQGRMGGSCAPVVNIYCGCQDDAASGTAAEHLIHLTAAYSHLMTDHQTGEIEQGGYYYPISSTAPIFNNFMPVHFGVRIVSAAFIKTRESDATTKVMEIRVVVLKNDGTVLRTITSTPLDMVSIPLDSWVPFDLVGTPADLTIGVDEMMAIKVTVDRPGGNYAAIGSFGALAEVLA